MTQEMIRIEADITTTDGDTISIYAVDPFLHPQMTHLDIFRESVFRYGVPTFGGGLFDDHRSFTSPSRIAMLKVTNISIEQSLPT